MNILLYNVYDDDDMKKNEAMLFVPAFLSIGLMILLALIFTTEMKKKKALNEVKNDYIIEIEKEDECSSLISYTNEIKTLCIKEIYYLQNGKDSLRSALNKIINMDNLLDKLSVLEKTDNYEIYEDDGVLSKTKFKILVCNNKYIIGLDNLEYNEGLCD